MYLAQYYDETFSASTHPTITIDSGYLLASQGPKTYSPVGSTGVSTTHYPEERSSGGGEHLTFTSEDVLLAGYWQCDRSRYTACLIHASGGPSNFNPLREAYTNTWSKSFNVSEVKSL